MDMITQPTEVSGAKFEEERVDPIEKSRPKDHRPRRYYGAETIYDVLDPRSAIFEGVVAQNLKS